VVAATQAMYDTLHDISTRVATVEHVVGLDLDPSHPHSYSKLMERGDGEPVPFEEPEQSETAGLVYTSGTTGEPKGVVLSHGNICSNINSVQTWFHFGPKDRSLTFLPWAHSFGQTAELHTLLSRGCALAINDAVTNLIANLAEVKPTVLIAVPRVFNRIFDGVHRQIAQKPAPIRALFRTAIRTATRKKAGLPVGRVDALGLALADKLIFSTVRAKFGGELRFAISGSAALNRDVAEFIDALGIEVYEGYGLTETSPIVSANCPGYRKMGSVGRPVPGVRVLIDTEITGDARHGEILVDGPNVMQGYHNRPDETREVLMPDRTLRTGDMGYLDEDGYLYITGRIKEQYKLETGRYVAPAPLEEKLSLSPFIAIAFLHGANKPHNVALIVPDRENLKRWAEERKIELGDICENPAVKKLIRDEIERHSADFKSYERPQSFLVVSDEFTPDNGLLTPSLKLRRRNVLRLYGERLETLY
jgi:long-chain acyl-CoA synthetase